MKAINQTTACRTILGMDLNRTLSVFALATLLLFGIFKMQADEKRAFLDSEPFVLENSLGVDFLEGDYCIPTSSGNNADEIRNFTLANLDNDSAASEGLDGSGYSDYTSIVSPAILIPGESYEASLTSGSGSGNHGAAIWIDYNENGIFEAEEMVAHLPNSIAGNSTVTFPAFTTPDSPGFYRLRVQYRYNANGENLDPCAGGTTYSETEDYAIVIMSADPCEGVPSPGMPSSTQIMVCPNTSFTVSVDGSSDPATGLSAIWQFSPANENDWTDVEDATYPYYNLIEGIDSATDFRYKVYCENSNETIYSEVIKVEFKDINDCYCIPSGSGNNTREIRNFTLANLNNDSAPSEGLHGPGYSDYSLLVSPALLVPGESYEAELTSGSGSGNHGAAIWIDYDENGIFEAEEMVAHLPNSITSNSTVTFPAFTVPDSPGTYRLRVQYRYNANGESLDPCNGGTTNSETEDYPIIILALDECAGTPSAGTPSSTQMTVCANLSFTLSVEGASYPAEGLDAIWQSSPADENDWTDIEGATTPDYDLTTGVDSDMDFRYKVYCENSDQTIYSEIIKVELKEIDDCYCIPLATTTGYYINDFITSGGIHNIENISSGFSNIGYGDFTGMVVSQKQGKTVDFTVNTSSSTGLRIWVDWNQDGIFDTEEEVAYHSSARTNPHNGFIEVPLDALPGYTRMRINSSYSSQGITDPCSVGVSDAEFEDYTFNVIALEDCVGTPSAGAPEETEIGVCPDQSFELSVLGATDITVGLTRTWQSSPADQNDWTNIESSFDTSLSVSEGVSEDTDYRYHVSCGENSSTSEIIEVRLKPGNECYCEPTTSYTGYYINSIETDGAIEEIVYANSISGYLDHSDQILETYGGQTFDIKVGFYSGSNSVAIWADWNDNGSFDDDGERLNPGVIYGSSPQTFSVTIPEEVTGDFRMRIRAQYGSAVPPSCGNTSYGTTVDFTLRALDLEACTTQIAGIPELTNLQVCPDNAFTLSVEGASEIAPGISRIWQSSPADENEWTDIEGAHNPSFEVTNGIELDMDYRYVVTCEPADETSISEIIKVTLKNVADCYCIPGGTNSNMYINNFTTTDGLLNIENTSSGFSPGGYGDFTSMIASQIQGETVNFTANVSGGTAGFRIWVDWNQDGVFDPTQEVAYYSSSYASAHSGVFEVPEDALSGVTRMRIASHYSNSQGNINPCTANHSGGEFEDYTFVVGNPEPCQNPVAGIPEETELSVCEGVRFTISVSSASEPADGLTRYWQSSPADQNDWTDIDSSYSSTLTVLDGISSDMDYRFVVECEDDTAFSDIISVTLGIPIDCYCIPDILNGCSIIELSDFGLYHNTGIVQYDSGCQGGPYHDLTDTVIELTSGYSYAGFAESVSSYPVYLSIWLDINQDGEFSSSERIALISNINDGPKDFVLNIPDTDSGILSGETRMRIGAEYNQAPVGACSWNYGSSIDYTVIIDESACSPPSDLQMEITSYETADISWTPSDEGSESGYEYVITTNLEFPQSGTFTTDSSVENVTITSDETNYLFVRSVCGNEEYSQWKYIEKYVAPPGQIGAVESNYYYLPIYSYYGYNYSQQIYTAAELSEAISEPFIEKLSFYYAEGLGNGTNWSDWTIYIGHTDKDEFESRTDWIDISEMIPVYSGIIEVPPAGNWIEIPFDFPFEWDGVSNLVIAVDENTPGYQSGNYFGVFSTEGESRALSYYSDSYNPDPADPPTAITTTYNAGYVNTIRLGTTDSNYCSVPFGITVEPGLYTADVFWDFSPSYPETSVDYYLSTYSLSPDEDTTPTGSTASGVTTLQLEDLEVDKIYFLWLKAHCSENESSAWSERVSFTTLYKESLVWEEGFTYSVLPRDWTSTFTYTNSSSYFGVVDSYFHYRSMTSTATYNLVTPYLGSIEEDSYLSFDYIHRNSQGTIKGPGQDSGSFLVEIQTYPSEDWEVLDEIDNDDNAFWQEAAFDLSLYAGEDIKIRVTAQRNSGSYYVGLDNFRIGPSEGCPKPEDIMVEQISETTANISWTASLLGTPDGYEYAVSLSESTINSTTFTTENSVEGIEVTPGEFNYFYVRSVCGDYTYSEWIKFSKYMIYDNQVGEWENTYSILPIGSCSSYNYSQQIYTAEELEILPGQLITKISFYYAISSGSTANWDNWTIYMGNTEQSSFTSNSSWVNYDDLTMVFSGDLDIPEAGNWIEIELDNPFLYNGTDNLVIAVDENVPSYNCTAYFGVYYTEDNRSMYYSASSNPDPVNPPNSSGYTSKQLNIIRIDTEASDEDFCVAPLGISAENVWLFEADITWTEPSEVPSEGYEYYYSDQNNQPDENTTPSGYLPAGTTSVHIDELEINTTYYFWIRSNCGDENWSDWSQGASFKTMDMESVVWEENFNSGTPPLWDFGNFSRTNSTTLLPGAEGYYMYRNLYGTGIYSSAQVVTPYIGVLGNADYMSFDYAHKNVGSSNFNSPGIGSGNIKVEIQVYPSQNWIELWTVENNEIPNWQSVGQGLNDYAGEIVRFRITGQRLLGDYYLGFDNFRVGPSDCTPPAGLGSSDIAFYEADISWTHPAISPFDGYEYYFSTSSTAPDASTIPNGSVANNVTTTHLADLNPNTTYYFWVRSNCGTDDLSDWSSRQQFTTMHKESVVWEEKVSGGYPNNWDTGSYSRSSSTSYLPGGDGYYLYKSFTPTNSGPYSFTTSYIGELEDNDLLSFDYAHKNINNENGPSSNSGYTTIEVQVYPSEDWTELSTVINNGVPGWQSSTDFDLSAYSGEIIRLRFTGTRILGEYYLGFDNFRIGPEEGCSEQPTPVISDVTHNSATITWDLVDDIEGYQYALTQSATSPSQTNFTTEVSTDYENLSGNTTYFFWLRTVCEEDLYGIWVFESFTTDPIPCVIDVETTMSSSTDCLLEGMTFQVSVKITGSSGNSSYSITDNYGNVLTYNAYMGSNYSRNYLAGQTPIFLVEGNQDNTCFVETDPVEGPPMCEEVECEITLTAEVDSNTDCVIENGTYPVNVMITGDAMSLFYTILDGSEVLMNNAEINQNYTFYFDEGVDASIWAYGNYEEDTCFTEEVGVLSPEVCPAECLVSLSAVSNFTGDCLEEDETYTVTVIISGSSESEFYTILNGQDVLRNDAITDKTYEFTFEVGEDVSIWAYGNEEPDTCSTNTVNVQSPNICPPDWQNASNLMLQEVDDESAVISWSQGGEYIGWKVIYGLSGFDKNNEAEYLGSQEILASEGAQASILGLSAGTGYQVYVRTLFDDANQGQWVGALNILTNCLGNPTLSTLGYGAYENTIVNPQVGAPDTNFEFKVLYTNDDDILPPYGYPRVILDYEGNGVFTNSNDRTIVLTPEDPTDNNVINGKVYIGSITQLPSGTNWKMYVQVMADGCLVQVGPFDGPSGLNVLFGPDLEIFANDITFDNPNPNISSPLTVYATIHNKSDLPAENFIVHLHNQFAYLEVYEDITVDYLGPQQSTTVSWDIITPPIESWNPMEVTVDYTNVILETNEDNNQAVRPFTNGEFEIPGAINVIAQASPSVIQLPQGTYDNRIQISGHAYYTDTAVPLQDSTVAGATVTFVNPITGVQHQTYTNSNGYFSFRTPHGSQIGEYSAPVVVTDFTITGEDEVSWKLVQGPCFPDLQVTFAPGSKTILKDEFATGTVTVKNIGCAPVEVETLLEMNQTGGVPILPNHTVPPLLPNESVSFEFTLFFDTVGTYYVTAFADANEVVEESNESNNSGTFRVTVNPPVPDITPYGSERLGLPRYLCNINENHTVNFSLRNIGYVPTDTLFDNVVKVYYEGNLIRTDTIRVFDNIPAGGFATLTLDNVYQNVGRYDFTVQADIPIDSGGLIAELSETNNVKSYYQEIIPCRPNLGVRNCQSFQVNLIDPDTSDWVTYTAEVYNQGNDPAEGPIDFKFVLSNGEEYPFVYDDDIQPGQTVVFTTDPVTPVSSGNETLTAIVDPDELIDDTSRANNSVTENLCYEFEPAPLCSSNFWGRYNQFETAIPRVGLKVNHLYKASEVKVRFEVQEPGGTDWIQLGDAVVQNPTRCHGCPYYAGLSNSFVFNQTGIYTFKMTADPDNEYLECDESNNVLIKTVQVGNQPDMRVLSHHIHPSKLNPEADEAIFFTVSYENIGYSNIGETMDFTLRINNDEHSVVHNVPGLIKNTTNTVVFPVPFSSDIEGLHVARAIIDSNEEVNDSNRLNNEATRSFVVGAAANLYFDNFAASNETPLIGEEIEVEAFIRNNGELDVDAEVMFSYISHDGDTIQIGTQPIFLDAGVPPNPVPGLPITGFGVNEEPQGEIVTIPWVVQQMPVTIVGEIINSSELEFDYTDNLASTRLNFFGVSFETVMSCEDGLGSLTAIVTGGTPPYTYHWDTGYEGQTLEAGPGTYSVLVIDSEGTQASATGVIEENPDCIVLVCSLSAVSFNISPECDFDTGTYASTLVVAYENAPSTGFISVNGTDYPITGSPQTFAIDLTMGPVEFDVSFTDSDDCGLLIITGITLDECKEDCVVPDLSASVVDADGDALACVEQGGNYYVLLEWTGGSGNDTYRLTDNAGEEIATGLPSEGTYLAGPVAQGTTVSYRIRGEDDNACSVLSATFNPDSCELPCDAVTDISYEELDWNKYKITWISDANSWTVSVNNGVGVTVSDQEYLMEDLMAETTYIVSVTAHCDDNDSGDTTIVLTTSSDPTPVCEVVDDLAYEELAWNQYKVTWTGNANSWTVSVNGESGVQVNDPEFMMEDLEAETEYTVSVIAHCDDGDSDAVFGSFTTGSAPITVECDEVTDLDFEALAWNQYKVTWTSDANSWTVSVNGDAGVQVSVPEFMMEDLDPETEYTVSVIAHCDDSDSDAVSGSFTTGEAPDSDCDEEYFYISRVWANGPGDIEDEKTSEFDSDAVDSNTHITTPVTTPGYANNTDITYELNKSLGNMLAFAIEADGNHPNHTYHYEVWVDRNLDQVLSNNGWGDYNELMVSADILGGNLAGSFDLNDPLPIIDEFGEQLFFCDIPNGIFPMRIIMTVYDADCNEVYGETEDYLFEVAGDCNDRLSVDNQIFDGFVYYPNPIDTQLMLEASKAIEQVELYSLLGQKVISLNPNDVKVKLDTEILASGVYMLEVTIDGARKSFKVVKK